MAGTDDDQDYLTLGCATIWNWFEEKLLRA